MKRLIFGPCIFHIITGLYCPGCGGRRSVKYLLTGHPLLSFVYHPIVLYTLVALFYISVRKLLDKKYHPSSLWLWVALIIVILNCLIKNIALLNGFDLLAIGV